MEYERLVARHKDAVYRQMVRVCGNHDDAEDVLVEALLSAYRASETLRAEANFRGWLATIGRRACGKLKQREALRPVLHLSALQEATGAEPASMPQIEQELEMSELKQCIGSAIGGLAQEYRQVYQLREIEGASAAETAARLGISVAAVKSRLHRARKQVREALDQSICGPSAHPSGA